MEAVYSSNHPFNPEPLIGRLHEALSAPDAESAWGGMARVLAQTAEEFFRQAADFQNDRLRFSAMKSADRLVREVSRHFEWQARRDQKEADREAKKVNSLNGKNSRKAILIRCGEPDSAESAADGLARELAPETATPDSLSGHTEASFPTLDEVRNLRGLPRFVRSSLMQLLEEYETVPRPELRQQIRDLMEWVRRRK